MEIGQSMFSFQNLDFSQLISSMGPEMLALLSNKTQGHEDFFQQLISQLLLAVDKTGVDKSVVGKQDFANAEVAKSLFDPKGILTNGEIHPELAKKVATLLNEAHAQGLDVFAFEGFRSIQKQNALYESGQGVTQATGGNSYHNYGLAVDVVFKNEKGNPSWDENYDWQKLGEIGKSLGLKWGGDFKKPNGQPFKDLAHFEFHPGLNMSQVKEAFAQGGKDFLWQMISSK